MDIRFDCSGTVGTHLEATKERRRISEQATDAIPELQAVCTARYWLQWCAWPLEVIVWKQGKQHERCAGTSIHHNVLQTKLSLYILA